MPNLSILIRSKENLDFDLENDIDWNRIAGKVFEITNKQEYAEQEVVLSFCDEAEIQYLNATFRNKDYVTDVLSFNAANVDIDLSDLDEEIENQPLGDIVICIQKAQTQAKEIGQSLQKELIFLFVHGLLHLLGYDHERSEADEKQMFALQDSIIESLR